MGATCRQIHRCPLWSSWLPRCVSPASGWWHQRALRSTCEQSEWKHSRTLDAQCHSQALRAELPARTGCCRFVFYPQCHCNKKKKREKHLHIQLLEAQCRKCSVLKIYIFFISGSTKYIKFNKHHMFSSHRLFNFVLMKYSIDKLKSWSVTFFHLFICRCNAFRHNKYDLLSYF